MRKDQDGKVDTTIKVIVVTKQMQIQKHLFLSGGYGYTRNSPRIPKDDQGQDTKSGDDKKVLNDRRSSTPPVAVSYTHLTLPTKRIV